MVANNAKAISATIKLLDATWCKPNEGMLKLSVDAYFHLELSLRMMDKLRE
jgi:hypothetical protein